MTAATASRPVAAVPPLARRGGWRARAGRLERPLLVAGLALVALHLLDLAFSGPDTALLGVLAIVAIPVARVAAQPYLVRPTRAVTGIVLGLLTFGFATVSHGLHVVNSGLAWHDVTGVGMMLGGLLLVASGLLAVVAPGRPPRRRALGWRAAHVVGWAAGAFVVLLFAVMPLLQGLMTTHAPRWKIQESSLGIPHEEVRIEMADGNALAAWYVPSRNRTAVLVSHGSGGSRERVASTIEMLARHGYGVLAFDLRGNGESEGHSNGLGDNAQPAAKAALDWLSRRPDVDPARIAGFGSSLGGEVLLHAAADDPRLRAVVSDGGARPADQQAAEPPGGLQRAVVGVGLQVIRGISGMRTSPSLNAIVPRIAPRPVLLIAAGQDPAEIPAARVYRERGGPSFDLWELPEANHTAGLRTYPAEYEKRTTGFLDRALGL